jgi:hypothetical protein
MQFVEQRRDVVTGAAVSFERIVHGYEP